MAPVLIEDVVMGLTSDVATIDGTDGKAGPSGGRYLIVHDAGPLEPWFDRTWKPGDIERIR